MFTTSGADSVELKNTCIALQELPMNNNFPAL
jgi:hypothetical protein